MVDNSNSRRGFLRGMAILSATCFLESPASVFAAPAKHEQLLQQWRRFCELNGGAISLLQKPIADVAIQTICKGHKYALGMPVSFVKEKLLAQPIWIYWGGQQATPNDAVFSFFTDTATPQTIFRINRFELETMNHLAVQSHAENLIGVLHSNAINESTNRNTNPSLIVKTIIGEQRQAKTNSVLYNHQYVLEHNIIYNA